MEFAPGFHKKRDRSQQGIEVSVSSSLKRLISEGRLCHVHPAPSASPPGESLQCFACQLTHAGELDGLTVAPPGFLLS